MSTLRLRSLQAPTSARTISSNVERGRHLYLTVLENNDTTLMLPGKMRTATPWREDAQATADTRHGVSRRRETATTLSSTGAATGGSAWTGRDASARGGAAPRPAAPPAPRPPPAARRPLLQHPTLLKLSMQRNDCFITGTRTSTE